jgi:hypothetical protein
MVMETGLKICVQKISTLRVHTKEFGKIRKHIFRILPKVDTELSPVGN